MVCGLVTGLALGSTLPHIRATLLSALAGALIAAAGSTGPSRISRRVAGIAAGLALALTVVAFATGNHPVWAAIAMAAVAMLSSLAPAAGPLGAVLGFWARSPTCSWRRSPALHLTELFSVPWATAHIAVGCLAGLIVVFIGTTWRTRSEPEELRSASAPLPVRAI